jgi:hypothetical protein
LTIHYNWVMAGTNARCTPKFVGQMNGSFPGAAA